MNQIHETAILTGNVTLGRGNVILPYTSLIGPLEIGDGNIIGPNVVIGSPGQDTRNPRYDSSGCKIKIGSNNIIREFTAIQKPAYKDLTLLGDDIFLMQSVHIPHDAILEDKVVITPMVVLAGITRIMEGANLGISSSVNQYCIVGQYSLVAAGANVVKNVKPFSRFIPGKNISVNEYAVNKFGFSENIDEISKYVLEDIVPISEKIGSMIERFNYFHVESGRKLY